MNAKRALKAAVFVSIIGTCGFSPAAILSPGDIVVSSLGELSVDGDGVIFKVDPVTGDRSIISGPGVGSGPGFEPYGVAIYSMQKIYFTEYSEEASVVTSTVYSLDVTTGDRNVIASSTVGTGPTIQFPYDILVREDGKLIVSDHFGDKLVLIDPLTLERTIISGPAVGSGPTLAAPLGMTLGANDDIFVATLAPTNNPSSALIRVDTLTGVREVVSASDVGNGPEPDLWSNVVVDGDERVLVTSFAGLSPIHGVLAVDLPTGDREILSASGIGVGPTFLQPLGIGVEADGDILVTNESFPNEDSLIRIDPATGDRTIVSGFGIGSGPSLQNPQLLDIVPVPAPSSIILLCSGVMAILIARWYRGECSVAEL